VKFADQYILGTIGFYLRQRGGIENDRLEQLLSQDFDGMVKGVYAAAIRDLQPLFTRKQREALESEVVFSPANIVKGSWREEARGHIEAEWEARVAVGDPLAGVPMLAEDATPI
jgi:hypothetical protein